MHVVVPEDPAEAESSRSCGSRESSNVNLSDQEQTQTEGGDLELRPPKSLAGLQKDIKNKLVKGVVEMATRAMIEQHKKEEAERQEKHDAEC